MVNPHTTGPRPLWFLRSLADGDTHRGSYSTVTRSVHADCGVAFVPRVLPLGGPARPVAHSIPIRSARSATAPRAPGDPLGALGYLAGSRCASAGPPAQLAHCTLRATTPHRHPGLQPAATWTTVLQPAATWTTVRRLPGDLPRGLRFARCSWPAN
jgi:hypothetical protein